MFVLFFVLIFFNEILSYLKFFLQPIDVNWVLLQDMCLFLLFYIFNVYLKSLYSMIKCHCLRFNLKC